MLYNNVFLTFSYFLPLNVSTAFKGSFLYFVSILYSSHTLGSETHAGHVETIAKFHIHQTHVGDTFKMRYVCVGYAWCMSIARRYTSLKMVRASCALGLRKFVSILILKKQINAYTSKIFSVLIFYISPTRVWVIRYASV